MGKCYPFMGPILRDVDHFITVRYAAASLATNPEKSLFKMIPKSLVDEPI
jgi:hypothetical protein